MTTLTPLQTAKWELGVSCLLHNWQILRDAVTNTWGGPESADKRDWLCGAIADMFVERPDTDALDVEDTLLQVMEDEFSVVLEENVALEVAQKVVIIWEEVGRQEYAKVEELHRRFLERQQTSEPKASVEEGAEEAGSSDEEEDEGEASTPATPAPRMEPVIDEDGFELVQKRKR